MFPHMGSDFEEDPFTRFEFFFSLTDVGVMLHPSDRNLEDVAGLLKNFSPLAH